MEEHKYQPSPEQEQYHNIDLEEILEKYFLCEEKLYEFGKQA